MSPISWGEEGVMIRVALYSRKSNEQYGVAEGDKSVTRQNDDGRAFVASKPDWTVVEDHVYIDDAVSGAEFKNRPGLLRMLAALAKKPRPIDVIVMWDETRLGRDQYRTGAVLQTIADAGVKVWYYRDNREAKLTTAMDKAMEGLRAVAAELKRETDRSTAVEGRKRRVARGVVATGRVFGYRNAGTKGGRHREIEPTQAPIVVHVFEMAAQGFGKRRIADALEAERVPSPTGKGWADEGVRIILHNELYHGVLVDGKSANVDKDGEAGVKVRRPKSEWTRVDVPHLRIVDEKLWEAAHARMAASSKVFDGHRSRDGRLHGRPESLLARQHLLSGWLTCGVCGANLFVLPSDRGGKSVLHYVCQRYWKRGKVHCSNSYRVPYEWITSSVLGNFNPDALRAAVSQALLDQLYRQPLDPAPEDQRATIDVEVKKLEQEIGNLVNAVAAGGDIPELVTRLKAVRTQRDAKVIDREALAGTTPDFDITDEEAVEEWQRECLEAVEEALEPLSGTDPGTARQILRGLLPGPIAVTPVIENGKAVDWTYLGADATLDRVIAGRLTPRGVPTRTTR